MIKLSKNKKYITITVLFTFIVAIFGSFYFKKSQDKQQMLYQNNYTINKSSVIDTEEKDTMLMEYVSTNLYNKKYKGPKLEDVQIARNTFLTSNKFSEKDKVWRSMCSLYDKIVNNAKIKDPNSIIRGKNLAAMQSHYKNVNKIEKNKAAMAKYKKLLQRH